MSFSRREILPRLLPNALMRRAQRACELAGLERVSFDLQFANELLHGEAELRELRRYCDPTRHSIDVGAAHGLYVRVLRKHSASCIAFEPNPASYRQLRRHFPGVRIENCALSSTPGVAELRVPVVDSVRYAGFGTIDPENSFEGIHGASTASFTVKVRTLDEFGFDNVGLVKIDVEGHEFETLLGGQKTIERSLPNLMIEIEERHHRGNLSRVASFLDGLGYRGFFILDGALRPMEEFDLAKHQNYAAARRRRDYHNNFLFLRSEH